MLNIYKFSYVNLVLNNTYFVYKIILFVVLNFFCILNCNAQYNDTITNISVKKLSDIKNPGVTIIKTNPFIPLWGAIPYTGEYRIVLETMTDSRQSLQFGASYLDKSLYIALIDDTLFNPGLSMLSFAGYRIQGAYKFYLQKNKKPLRGIYVGPLVSWSVADVSHKQNPNFHNYVRITHFNANFISGCQFVINRFAIDVFYGLGYKKNVWYERNTSQNYSIINTDELGFLYNSHLKLILGFNMGLAF